MHVTAINKNDGMNQNKIYYNLKNRYLESDTCHYKGFKSK